MRTAHLDYSVLMPFIQHLHPDNPSTLAAEDYADFFDFAFPDWQTRQDMGERFLSESDFPVEPPTAPGTASMADWEAYREATYSDPFEGIY